MTLLTSSVQDYETEHGPLGATHAEEQTLSVPPNTMIVWPVHCPPPRHVR